MSDSNGQEKKRPAADDRPVLTGPFFTQLLVVAFLLIGLVFLGLIPQQLGLRPQLELIPTSTARPSPTVTPTPTERPVRVFLATPTPSPPAAQPTPQQTPVGQNP